MYFLWRGKPRSVLGNNREWISAQEIESRIDGIMVFPTAEGARAIQKRDFPKDNVSVINKKTFLQKTKMRKLPVFKTVPADIDIRPQETECRHYLIDRLESLCAVAQPGDSAVVFPPSNLNDIFNTPTINRARQMLIDIQQRVAALKDEEEQLQIKLQQISLLISDQIHQAEMIPISEEDCPYFVRELRGAMIERRKIKNELAAVQIA